jgi:hypothetical protein
MKTTTTATRVLIEGARALRPWNYSGLPPVASYNEAVRIAKTLADRLQAVIEATRGDDRPPAPRGADPTVTAPTAALVALAKEATHDLWTRADAPNLHAHLGSTLFVTTLGHAYLVARDGIQPSSVAMRVVLDAENTASEDALVRAMLWSAVRMTEKIGGPSILAFVAQIGDVAREATCPDAAREGVLNAVLDPMEAAR